MNKRKLITIFFTLLILGELYLLYQWEDSTVTAPVRVNSAEAPKTLSRVDTKSFENQVSGNVIPDVQVPLQEGKKTQSVSDIETKSNQVDFTTGQEIENRLVQITQMYANSLKYPLYSRPLHETDHSLLHPNEFIPIKRPLDQNQVYSYDVLLPHFVLFRPDPIPVTFRLFSSGPPLPQVHYVRAEVQSEGKVVDQFELTLVKEGDLEKHYFFQYTPSSEKSATWASELHLKMTFLMTGYNETPLVTLFKYVESNGQITGKGEEQVEGPHLLIPLRVLVKSPGLFKITANLFSQTTNKPIANLSNNKKLDSLESDIPLQVHIATLKQSNDEGPYLLKDIMLFRLPENAGEQIAYGNPSARSYTIEKQPLSEYKDEPYENPREQKKLRQLQQFMKQLN